MIEIGLAILRDAVKERRHIISSHARIRMGERNISESDICNCSLRGLLIDEQDHGRDRKVLIQWVDADGKDFYLVAALIHPRPVIVTVSRFLDDIWEDIGPFKKRR